MLYPSTIRTKANPLLWLLPLLPLLLPGCNDGESYEVVIRKSVEVYGGADNLRATQARRYEGVQPGAASSLSAIKFERLQRSPTSLKVVRHRMGKILEVRKLERDEGYRQGVRVQGASLAAMQVQSARMSLPLLLLDRLDEVRDLGTRDQPQTPRRVFALTIAPKVTLEVEIDPSSYHVVRTIGIIEQEGQPPFEFTTVYEDLRQVDSVLIPFRELQQINGKTVATQQMEKVTFLPQ